MLVDPPLTITRVDCTCTSTRWRVDPTPDDSKRHRRVLRTVTTVHIMRNYSTRVYNTRKTFWIRRMFFDDWRCLRRSRLLTVDSECRIRGPLHLYLLIDRNVVLIPPPKLFADTSPPRWIDRMVHPETHQRRTSHGRDLYGQPGCNDDKGFQVRGVGAKPRRPWYCLRNLMSFTSCRNFAKWIRLWTADIHPGTKRNEFCWCQFAGWQQHLASDTFGPLNLPSEGGLGDRLWAGAQRYDQPTAAFDGRSFWP